jgi:ADP-ribosyl-[dinitrogen reductase] hydrolase
MPTSSSPRALVADAADRASGAVWGHLVGDAAGLPFEGLSAASLPPDVLPPTSPLDWSDDGALMLAQLDSLLWGGYDPRDFARRALLWLREGVYASSGQPGFGIGRTTLRALLRVEAGEPAERAGGARETDNGNGSLMRILPVGLAAGQEMTAGELIQSAQRLSSVTHRHPRAQVACGAYALIVHELVWSRRPEMPWRTVDAALTQLTGYYAATEQEAYLAEVDVMRGWDARTGTGYVVDSFWSACEAAFSTESYPAAVEQAIRFGNDTDTTAAIAGGLAGARWGLGGVPSEWRTALRGASLAERLVEDLRGRLLAGQPIELMARSDHR